MLWKIGSMANSAPESPSGVVDPFAYSSTMMKPSHGRHGRETPPRRRARWSAALPMASSVRLFEVGAEATYLRLQLDGRDQDAAIEHSNVPVPITAVVAAKAESAGVVDLEDDLRVGAQQVRHGDGEARPLLAASDPPSAAGINHTGPGGVPAAFQVSGPAVNLPL